MYFPVSFYFFFYYSGAHRDLHSFPTRRSSDLVGLAAFRPQRTVGEPLAVDFDAPLLDQPVCLRRAGGRQSRRDRKSTRLNSSHPSISYAVFCLKKKKKKRTYIILIKKSDTLVK